MSTQPTELIELGIEAIQKGDPTAGLQYLIQAVEEDPHQPIAWRWLYQLVETAEDKAVCIDNLLTINPQDSWALARRAELSTLPPPAAPAGPSDSVLQDISKVQKLIAAADQNTAQPPYPPLGQLHFRAVNCPQCRKPLYTHLLNNKWVLTVVCPACQHVVDLSGELPANLGRGNPQERPSHPLKLGQVGEFAGHKHRLIGWSCFEGRDEAESWHWEEWLLASEKGNYRWLRYSPETGFLFCQPLQAPPHYQPSQTKTIPTPKGKLPIVDWGQAKLIGLQGESIWALDVGQQIRFFEAEQGEYQFFATTTAEQLEILMGVSISGEQVAEAFGLAKLADQFETTPPTSLWVWVGVAGLAVFLLFLAFLVLWWMG